MNAIRIGCAAVAMVPWVFVPSTAAAQPDSKPPKFGSRGKGIGVGVSVGDPLGLSVKWFLHPQHALTGELGYGLLHHGDGIVAVNYHWHTKPIGDSPIVDAMVYFGLGVGLGFWAQPGPDKLQGHDQNSARGAALLLRVPAFGLAYHWTKVPLDTSLEIAWSPYIVLPDLRHLDASIKVRYFF